ncbi:MAG TPA: sigma-54-dependent Fis family transcriptional regulator [Bacillales bacterium]|nr:sigma-54-dependent Fis family transcriptional regulator [Bacillales bacterium]
MNGFNGDIVDASWKRSKTYGIDPGHVHNDLLTGGELKDREEQFNELLEACSPILDRLYDELKASLFMVLISDPDGYIVFSRGEPPFLHRAKKIWLHSGANWNEKVKGTNAIGTALVERQPVSIIGNQHFCRENQFLTCYASPLYAPTGELLGVLDISGDARLHHPHTYGMVKAAAQACQSQLLLKSVKKELALSLQETDVIADQYNAPLLSVDDDGIIVHINEKAAEMLDEPANQCIGQPLSKWFNADDMEKILNLKNRDATQVKMKTSTKMWRVEPIQDQRQKIFRSVLSLPAAKTTPAKSENQMVWSCPKAEKILRLARNVAKTNATILIRGETGTGKEIIAREIHETSGRKGELVTINCGAIPEQLITSELFGYEKGAFTGANQRGHIGKFAAAHKGTLFLDEIGEMPPSLQVALLRVIEEKKITPIGSNRANSVDVRILAATNRNLIKDINEGQFRADLYYRLCEIELTLPPLRERSDLLELADSFLREMAGELNERLVMEEDAERLIQTYDWPGNIRELRHVLRQAAYQANFIQKSSIITEKDLHFPVEENAPSGFISGNQDEEEEIASAIQKAGGNLSRAADLLGIGRTTLYRKMNRFPRLKQLRKQAKRA